MYMYVPIQPANKEILDCKYRNWITFFQSANSENENEGSANKELLPYMLGSGVILLPTNQKAMRFFYRRKILNFMYGLSVSILCPCCVLQHRPLHSPDQACVR